MCGASQDRHRITIRSTTQSVWSVQSVVEARLDRDQRGLGKTQDLRVARFKMAASVIRVIRVYPWSNSGTN